MNQRWARATGRTVIGAALLAAFTVVGIQSPATEAKADDAVPQATAGQEQASTTEQGVGLGAIDRAAKADRYAFVFFFRSEDERTQSMRTALESAVSKLPDKAGIVAVDVTDPAQEETVSRFDVSRTPMPLVLAVAPTGAITRYWVRTFDARQLEQAFVSPGESHCLKALQESKMVLVCIQNGKTARNDEAMQGVNDFTTDRQFATQTAIVSVDPTNEVEASFLAKLRVSPETEEAVTVLMAPPGRTIATFTGATNKADIVAATKKAGAGCDPKSGCCPAKKPAAQATEGEKSGETKQP